MSRSEQMSVCGICEVEGRASVRLWIILWKERKGVVMSEEIKAGDIVRYRRKDGTTTSHLVTSVGRVAGIEMAWMMGNSGCVKVEFLHKEKESYEFMEKMKSAMSGVISLHSQLSENEKQTLIGYVIKDLFSLWGENALKEKKEIRWLS